MVFQTSAFSSISQTRPALHDMEAHTQKDLSIHHFIKTSHLRIPLINYGLVGSTSYLVGILLEIGFGQSFNCIENCLNLQKLTYLSTLLCRRAITYLQGCSLQNSTERGAHKQTINHANKENYFSRAKCTLLRSLLAARRMVDEMKRPTHSRKEKP